jgi:putative membrane protein
MKPLRDAWALACLDWGLLRRFPRLWLPMVGIVLIPAAYALIYLSSVWDPAARTKQLPAAVVNLDAGLVYRGQTVNVGEQVAANLKARRLFGFEAQTDADTTRQAVREGRYALAVIIPRDFSANAVPGAQAGAGRLIVYVSEGNNATLGAMARRFASELGHQVNETLNEQRWALVLQTAAGSEQSVRKLADGVAQLRQGAHELANGSAQLDTGALRLQDGMRSYDLAGRQLTEGMKQVAGGIRTMDARRPPAADLQALRSGSAALVDGQAQLGRGLEQLQGGAEKLAAGAQQLHDESEDIPFVGGKIADAATALNQGATQLGGGLQQSRQASRQLGDGADKLRGGVAKLTDGVSAMGDGVHQMATRLPSDAKLDEFAAAGQQLFQGAQELHAGTGRLKAGAAQLAGGLDLLEASLPRNLTTLEGSARGLADSVQPVIEAVAPISTNGSGFGPNFACVALWLGAVMTTFLFHVRRLHERGEGASRLGRLLGRVLPLLPLVMLQTVCVLAVFEGVLEMPWASIWRVAVTMAVASVTFLLVVLALLRAFGDTGKGIALLLLVLQLSASGGITPVELTGDVFQGLSPWLPFTWVVRALRVGMFGAFDGAWWPALAMVVVFAAVAFASALWFGRWVFVRDAEHRPAFDV